MKRAFLVRSALVVFATLAALLLPTLAGAIDAPHDASFGRATPGACDVCHKLHSGGGTLVNQPTNDDTCASCHSNNPTPDNRLGFPWLSTDQAVPGVGGSHHSWSGYSENAGYGARSPGHAELAARLVAGRLQCATCHDQHAANAANGQGRVHTSIAIGSARPRTGGTLASTATLTLSSVGAAAVAKGYRIQISRAGQFVISHDFKLANRTWFQFVANTWLVGGTPTSAGKPYVAGTPVTLDDPAVSVTISAGAQIGDYWDFYVSYPFLRVTIAADQICRECHADRFQDHLRVRGSDVSFPANGTNVFSHPVGQALNANGLNTDLPAPLDAAGAADANATNDLVLRGGQVGCTTCHAVHGGDSNGLTVDPR